MRSKIGEKYKNIQLNQTQNNTIYSLIISVLEKVKTNVHICLKL